MKRYVALALCGALFAPAAALAAGQSADQPAPVKASTEAKKEKKICKREEEKGSRLGGKTTCRTKAEWDDIAYQQRMEIDRKINQGPARQ